MRLKDALDHVGNSDLWSRINDCKTGSRCSSLWCSTCRNNAAKAAEDKITSYTERMKCTNDSLIHLTAPVGLAQVDADSVGHLLKIDGLRWKKIRKKNSFWIEATYELELVNLQFLKRSNGSEVKKQQIQQMLEHSKLKSNEFLFIHWHGVSDLSTDEVSKVFENEYFVGERRLSKTAECGLYVQKLHTEKTLSENIRKIASYPFKGPYRYKHSFKGSDFSNGEYFTNYELGRLVTLYHQVQGRQWRSLRRHTAV